MKYLGLVAAALCLCLGATGFPTGSVEAAPITTPSGLSAGDQYRLAFVTSTRRDATSSDIGDYNAFVTNVANTQTALAALGTVWRAIGSTASIDARDNTGTNPVSSGVPIYLLDGTTKIADDNADLWDNSIDAPLLLDETGSGSFLRRAFTGSDSDGRANTLNPLGGPNGFAHTGVTTDPSFRWIRAGDVSSSEERHFYALSGILTLQTVPEPASLAILALGLTGLVFAGRRRAS